MTLRSFVCVIVIHGFLVAAFPTNEGDCDSDPGVVIDLPVSGVTEFHGTAPAKGSVTIVGHAPCNDPELPATFLNPKSVILPQSADKENAPTFTEFDETCPSKVQNYDEINNDQIPRKVILGAILADSMAERSAEIDAKLAEIDAFVESEIGTIGPIIQSALTNADTSEINSRVDSALLDMESKINSELTKLDEFIDLELSKTEELVECVIKNIEAEIEEKRSVSTIESEELPMLEAFVASTLEKSESLVESEIEKVNALVESELEKIDSIVESQLDKVDLFIEKELEKAEALVKSEMSKMESLVEKEMAKVENTMEEIADCINADSNAVPIISNLDGTIVQQTNENQAGTIVIEGRFPVSGRTVIIGNTGCPPPFPTGEPLPLYVESFPVFEDYEPYDPVYVSDDIVYDDIEDGCTFELPIVGKAVFSGVAPATGSCTILGSCPCDSALPLINSNISPPKVGDANPKIPLNQASGSYNKQYCTTPENKEDYAGIDTVTYQKEQLPMVEIRKNRLRQEPLGVILKRDVGFCGNTEAVGSTSFRVNFPCPPLTATEVGPDGKKYIWIAKKPSMKDTPKEQHPKPKPDFPTYTEEFPETVIMDANKNYQKHISEGMDVDFGHPEMRDILLGS